jgi:predicted ATPase
MHEGLVAMRTTGAELQRTHFLALLAEAYQKAGQTDAALRSLAEAFDIVNADGECYHEAELYRIKAELLLTQEIKRQESKGKNQNSESPNTQHLAPSTQAEAEREAEAYFRKAIEIACKQQAKSLELRAVTSLARLWRQQGKKDEARQMLAEIYNWFTEGFDTADLKDAKALLEELEGRATMTSGKKRRSSEERKKRKTQR